MIRRVLLALIGVYRRYLSPLKRTPTCRYLPTCSEYAHEAICTHGAASAVPRCNPLFHGGVHPVPPARSASRSITAAAPLTPTEP